MKMNVTVLVIELKKKSSSKAHLPELKKFHHISVTNFLKKVFLSFENRHLESHTLSKRKM